MKLHVFAWGVLGILLAACIVAPTALDQLPITPTPKILFTVTDTPTVLSVATATISSQSEPGSTDTRSPTSTIDFVSTATSSPQPTPTFNPHQVQIRTPQPPAVCPAENSGVVPNLVPNFRDPSDTRFPDFEQSILDFLNAGGTRGAVIHYLKSLQATEILLEQDLTNDGVPELLVGDIALRIYSCEAGKYYVAADVSSSDWPSSSWPIAIQDMNLDGIVEIVLERRNVVAVDCTTYHTILEWDGHQFQDVVIPGLEEFYDGKGWIQSVGLHVKKEWLESSEGANKSSWAIRDTDQNGTQELLIIDGVSCRNMTSQGEGGPWRLRTTTYMWNGKDFVLDDREYEAPSYRFEAVQDADQATLNKHYDRALKLYQRVISDPSLEWWSETRQTQEVDRLASLYNHWPTPTPPPKDYDEYPNLAAYARYRIVILQTWRDLMDEAQAEYEILQREFPEGETGHVYAELARIFWEEYQDSHRIRRACAKVIEYTRNHSTEILYYVASEHHSWQVPIYEPADVCPFW